MNPESDHRDECRLTVPNDIGLMPVALAFVRAMGSRAGFAEEALPRIELAAEEAVTGIIENAFAPGEKATLDIFCTAIPNGMEIRIHDMGLPYDPSLADEYDPGAELESQSTSGLSTFLIKQFMDEYEFVNLGPGGKETRMVKLLDTEAVGGEVQREPDLPAELEEAHPELPQDTPLEIRWMKPEEAIEVSRCVYDSYGYTYGYEHIYYPDRIAELNRSGVLRSAVAVVPDLGLAGHFALVFNEGVPPEMAVAVASKKFRGLGVGGRLAAFLDEQARGMDVNGIYVKQVTVHPFTQKLCRKLGYRDCGFLLAHIPATISFRGIADELGQRASDILGFRYFTPPPERGIFAPDHHREMIGRLFENIEAPVSFEKGVDVPEAEQSCVHTSINARRALGEIHMHICGRDIGEVLRGELRRLRREEVRVMEMYLNLQDPATPLAVAEAEKCGFFFTGILPETDGHDSLILQSFNGVQVEYESLTVLSDISRDLLAYIQRQDPDWN